MILSSISKIISEYHGFFLRGLIYTILLAVLGTVGGFLLALPFLGLKTAVIDYKRDSKLVRIFKRIGIWFTNIYTTFFRGTPMMVQSMVIYYGVAEAFGIQLNRLGAAIFIVSINTGAYMAEIVRGGIVSIDDGQFEAAHALGMNHVQTMFNVILPQVIRNILPATGNEFVVNIKDTSVLNVISITELFFQTKSIAGNTFKFFEPYFITCIIYFVMTFTVTRILRAIERKLDGPKNYNIIGNQMQVEKPEDILRKKRRK